MEIKMKLFQWMIQMNLFSTEAEETMIAPTSEDERTQVEKGNSDDTKEAEEKTNSSSADPSDGNRTWAKPQRSNLPCDSSLHPRDNKTTFKSQKTGQKRKKDGKRTKEKQMDLDDEDSVLLSKPDEKGKDFSYYHLMSYKRNFDKTFYFKYFRPHSQDYRRLRMEEDCQCPVGEIHSTQCQWYHPDTIYILYTKVKFQPVKKLPS